MKNGTPKPLNRKFTDAEVAQGTRIVEDACAIVAVLQNDKKTPIEALRALIMATAQVIEEGFDDENVDLIMATLPKRTKSAWRFYREMRTTYEATHGTTEIRQ